MKIVTVISTLYPDVIDSYTDSGFINMVNEDVIDNSTDDTVNDKITDLQEAIEFYLEVMRDENIDIFTTELIGEVI